MAAAAFGMTTPALAGWRFLMGVALGGLLGLWYGFLRPLGRRRRQLADLLFITGVFPVWVYHSFAVCQGDISIWYSLSLLLGGILTECTLGRLLRPVFRRIWMPVWGIFAGIRKIFQKIWLFLKIIFAYMKKMSTIILRKNGYKGGSQNELSGRDESVQI